MFKTMKDARRRMTQTVLATVGSAEKTEDPNYDAHVAKFDVMIADMNECGAALHSYLTKQKALFADGEELSKSLARVFDENLRMTDWPDVDCELKQCHAAEQYKIRMDLIQNVLRSSASTVTSEHALDPLKAAISTVTPEIHALKAERAIKVTDYDSYRRRLAEKEAKKQSLEAAGKGDTPAAADVQADIEKFQKKVQSGLEEYTYVNQKTKADVVAAKRQHDELMDQLIITTIVCQAELFTQAAAQLDAIIDTLPEDRVREVRRHMHEYVKQGGVRPAPAPEKSKLAIGLDLFTGKSVPSDLKKKDDDHHSSPSAAASGSALPRTQSATAGSSAPPAHPVAVAVPAPASTSGTTSKTSSFQAAKPNPFASGDPFEGGEEANEEEEGGNPFAGETTAAAAVAPPAAPVAPPAPPAATAESNMVEALFDHEAEEEDELNFSAGDFVEVIDKPDGGWWRGRFNGKEGLFPSNYVKS